MMAQDAIQDSTMFVDNNISDSLNYNLDTEPVQKKKSAIDAKIEYTSSDSMIITSDGIAYMYGAGNLTYKSMELSAEHIRVHMDSSILYAKGVFDTIDNEWIGKPVFSEGNDSYETDEITYNLRTQKGLILNGITDGNITKEKVGGDKA